MKTLTFADNTSIQVEDTSSVTSIIVKASGFAELAETYAKFTADNLKRVTFDGTVYTGLKLIGATATAGDTGVTMNVSTRTMSAEENIANQITELQEAVAELAAGGNA